MKEIRLIKILPDMSLSVGKKNITVSTSNATLRFPFILSRLSAVCIHFMRLLVCAGVSEKQRERDRDSTAGGREDEEVEAESYLVKNRLRAAHLVPFARTTSGLMHSARWKRASVCPRRRLGRRPRRRRRGAIDLSNVVAGLSSSSILTVRPDSYRPASLHGKGTSGTGVVVKSVKSP